ADNGLLREQLSVWARFGDGMVEPLLRGRLSGIPVLIVAGRGAGADLLDTIEDRVTAAGATRAGRIVLTDRWGLTQEAARERLAVALSLDAGGGPSPPSAADLMERAVGALAARLAVPSDLSEAADPISALAEAGFLDLDGVAASGFPPPGALVLAVAGESPAPGAQDPLPALVGALAGRRPLVVAQPLASPERLVPGVRADAALAATVGTVDHADTLPGQISIVYALADARTGKPAVHYGIRRGATAIAPPGGM
ncbi:MAG: copper transporter, partial [Acidobacteria bacterium]|nr:copper transporter [Acidobacteriota bacterium]